MAIRYATKTGNWSDPLTWDGQVSIPTAADDVYANNYTVTIDQDITVQSLNNAANTGIAVNGSFVPTNGITINANLICGATGANVRLLTTFPANSTVTINGNISSTNVNYCVYAVASGLTLNITGEIRGATNSTGHGVLWESTGGLLTVNGNIYGGNIGVTTIANTMGIVLQAGDIVVTGNVYGGGGSAPTNYVGSNGIYGNTRSNVISITINGNLYAGNGTVSSLSSAVTLLQMNYTSITINGNIYGSTSSTGAAGGNGLRIIQGTAGVNSTTINGTINGATSLSTAQPAVYINDTIGTTIINADLLGEIGGALMLNAGTIESNLIRSGSSGYALYSTPYSTAARPILIHSVQTLGYGGPIFGTTQYGTIYMTIVTDYPIKTMAGTGQLFDLSTGNGTLNIVGDIDERDNPVVGTTANLYFTYGMTLNITGNVYCGLKPGIASTTGNGTFTLNITGNVYAGKYHTSTGNSVVGITVLNNNNSWINVYGRVEATSGANNHGMSISAKTVAFAQVIKANNYPVGSTWAGYAITGTGAVPPTVCAIEYGESGLIPYNTSGQIFMSDTSNGQPFANYMIFRQPTAPYGIVNLGEVVADYPSTSNVRLGTKYNFNSQTGTCAVPEPGSVAKGVPVDNTVGTAVLTAEALWGLPTDQMTTPGSIGERLKNSSTVDTVAAQLAALL